MRKSRIDIAEDLHKEFPHLSESQQLRPIVNAIVDLFRMYLKAGHSIHLSKLGTIELRVHTPQVFVSNLTGLMVEIPARRIAKLRISKQLRGELNDRTIL